MKPVQLINHLPRAETSALKSFVEMESCTYARGLGKSRGQTDGDGMVCECSWRFGKSEPSVCWSSQKTGCIDMRKRELIFHFPLSYCHQVQTLQQQLKLVEKIQIVSIG